MLVCLDLGWACILKIAGQDNGKSMQQDIRISMRNMLEDYMF